MNIFQYKKNPFLEFAHTICIQIQTSNGSFHFILLLAHKTTCTPKIKEEIYIYI